MTDADRFWGAPELSLRAAEASDVHLLFLWANDPDVRANSFHTDPIPWDDHVRWFDDRLNDASCHIFIASLSGRPVGQVRFDIKDDVAVIDYSIASQYRGRGLGTKMLALAERAISSCAVKMAAHVKDDNRGSITVFERRGFDRERSGDHILFTKYSKNIAICTSKSWNIENALRLRQTLRDRMGVHIITDASDLTYERLFAASPLFVFFPHWSHIIPKQITDDFRCVVFHMTDLPFGRGGSPLQNLIVRGIRQTKISALAVDEGIDTGAIYMKQDLDLSGTAAEILARASRTIFDVMIPYILDKDPEPVPQSGDVVVFKRRRPEDGCITPDMTLDKIYDYIRMLDGEGYPPAFVEVDGLRLEFSSATLRDGELTAAVRFVKTEKQVR